jgi:hypothetical protein
MLQFLEWYHYFQNYGSQFLELVLALALTLWVYYAYATPRTRIHIHTVLNNWLCLVQNLIHPLIKTLIV